MADKRQRTREALERHRNIDAGASERERIGALVGMLAAICGIIAVGALPVAEAIRVPFLFVAFCFAFVLGLYVKRTLDDRSRE